MRNIYSELSAIQYAGITSAVGERVKIKPTHAYRSEEVLSAYLKLKGSKMVLLVDTMANFTKGDVNNLIYHIKHDVSLVASEDKTEITLRCNSCNIDILKVVKDDNSPHVIPNYEKSDDDASPEKRKKKGKKKTPAEKMASKKEKREKRGCDKCVDGMGCVKMCNNHPKISTTEEVSEGQLISEGMCDEIRG